MDRLQFQREKTLYRYTRALDRGDLNTIEQILQEASDDVTLAKMVCEVNEVYHSTDSAEQSESDSALVVELLHQHLPSGFPDEADLGADPLPLTVADVVGRIQSDAPSGTIVKEAREVFGKLIRAQKQSTVLPDKLNILAVRKMFTQLGINVTRHFEKLFRETAVMLSMGRTQSMAQLQAARRQRRKSVGTGETREENSNDAKE
jgi:hypothetical protein